VTQDAFSLGLFQDVMEDRVNELDRASSPAFFLLDAIELLNVDRLNLLQSHPTQKRKDVLLDNLPILDDGLGSASQFLSVQPILDKAIKRYLGAIVSHAVIDSGEHLFDPEATFGLALAVFG
jgi:hypothetical protein